MLDILRTSRCFVYPSIRELWWMDRTADNNKTGRSWHNPGWQESAWVNGKMRQWTTHINVVKNTARMEIYTIDDSCILCRIHRGLYGAAVMGRKAINRDRTRYSIWSCLKFYHKQEEFELRDSLRLLNLLLCRNHLFFSFITEELSCNLFFSKSSMGYESTSFAFTANPLRRVSLTLR